MWDGAVRKWSMRYPSVHQYQSEYSRSETKAVGSIVSHPFEFAQGRLLQKTQGWGTPRGMMHAENQAWAAHPFENPHFCRKGRGKNGAPTVRMMHTENQARGHAAANQN